MTAKPELMLHIGMGKTGTTALQHFFWENRSALARRGIVYPTTGATSKAHHLISPHVPAFLAGGDWTFLQPADWVEKVAALQAPRLLMSSELIAWASADVVAPFCAALQRHFDLKICLYLRRQDNIIMAGYNQQIKAGTQVLELDRVLGQQQRRFDYLARIVPWELAVGAENLVIRAYERGQFRDGDLIKDFLSGVLGITDWAGFDFDQGENSNPRFTRAALDFKRLINVIYQAPAETEIFNEALIEFSAREGSGAREIFFEQSTLTWAQRDEILKLAAPANAYIAAKFLGRDDGVLFREDLGPAPDAAEADEVTTDDLRAIVSFLRAERPKLFAALAARVDAQKSSGRKVLAKAAREMGRLLDGASVPAGRKPEALPKAAGALGSKAGPSGQLNPAKAQTTAAASPADTPMTLKQRMAAKRAARQPSLTVSLATNASKLAGATEVLAPEVLNRSAPALDLMDLSLPSGHDVVLHFGVRKTGSTSIQETLYRNPGAQSGYFYPDLGHANGTLVLQNAFATVESLIARRREVPGGQVRNKTKSRAMQLLTTQLAKARAGVPLILSSEGLDWLSPPEFTRMVRSLEAQAQSLRFVGYIREPVSYARSAFQESVKHGFPKRNMFLKPEADSLGKGYHEIVNQLDALVGRDRVDARAFDRARFPGGDVVKDFLTRAGVDPARVQVHRVNESLSATAVKLLYVWRKFTDADATDLRYPKSRVPFVKSMTDLGGPGLVIHPAMEDRLEADNRHIYDWAAQRLDVPLVALRNQTDKGLRFEQDLFQLSDEEAGLFADYAASHGVKTLPARAGPEQIAATMQDIRLSFVTPTEKLKAAVKKGRAALRG